jgi:ribosomal-protein-alanine N-acetyltransferase
MSPGPDMALPARDVERTLQLLPLTRADLDLVWETEKRAYAHPWSLRNFSDSLEAGYPAQLLVTPPLVTDTPHRLTQGGHMLLGYWVAMQVLDEVHVLNIAVAPEYRRQGWGHVLMQTLATDATARGAQCLWLEVRTGNAPARALYERTGFVAMGVRKQYYPAGNGRREDAIVMSRNLLMPSAAPESTP